MRKLIVEFKVKEEFLEMLNFLLDKTESIELIELIKLDFQKGIKMVVATLTMKEGYTIEDFEIPDNMEILTVLKQGGNRYVVFSKVKFLKKEYHMTRPRFLPLILRTKIARLWPNLLSTLAVFELTKTSNLS